MTRVTTYSLDVFLSQFWTSPMFPVQFWLLLLHPHTGFSWDRWGGLCCVYAELLGCVWFFMTPWTVARQVSLSMGFSRQVYWNGFPWLPQCGLILANANCAFGLYVHCSKIYIYYVILPLTQIYLVCGIVFHSL